MSHSELEPAGSYKSGVPSSGNSIEIAMKVEAEKRQAITSFIANHLKEGVDYGKIVGSKNCLLKPGAEKFCSLMKLRAEFKKDEETLSMIPEKMRLDNGIIAYVCILNSADGVVSEGRGACSIVEKKGQINTAIKIAEKRAMMDACLRAFSISDSFTQDMDDPEIPVESKGYKIDRNEPKDEHPGVSLAEINKIVKDLKWDNLAFGLFMEQTLERNFPDGIHWKDLTPAEKVKVFTNLKIEIKKADAPRAA